jgi:hypothetical protein
MPYVMLPVPEEHLQEAMEAVLRIITRANMVPWDEESFGEFFASVDEPVRAVCSIVAKAALSDKRIADRDAARVAELGVREVLQIAREVNKLAKDSGRPDVLALRTVPTIQPNGRTRQQRMLSMDPEVAQLVKAAEAAEQIAIEPRPAEDPVS